MLHLLSLKYLLKTNICVVQIKAAETDNKHFAQHPKFGDKTQTQICPHLPLPFHELDFTFLVPSFNSFREHTSLDLRGPPIPRTKHGIGPREDGRSFLHRNIIIQNHTVKAGCYSPSTHCALGVLPAKPHFMLTAALTENTVAVPILQLGKLRLREERCLFHAHTLSKQQSHASYP